jgi:dipeptidyl-peptidase-4
MPRPRPSLVALSLFAVACGGAPAPSAPCPEASVTSSSPRALEGATVKGPEASPIGFERIAKFPEPGWQIPRALSFGPGGKLTFLQSEGGGDEMALFELDDKGAPRVVLRARELLAEDKPLSREEELRRERQRSRIKGITQYAWAKKAPVLLVPLGGDLFVRDEKGLRRVTDTPEPELDAKLCDDGKRVVFVRGSEVVLLELGTKRETVLTKADPKRAGTTRGQSDFNAQEELDEPSGFFPSPSCEHVAFLEVDERKVREVPVLGYRAGAADLMQQRYPRAGDENPSVRLGVVDVRSKKTTWVKTPPGAYLGRFRWHPEGKALFFETLSRSQRELGLYRLDVAGGKAGEPKALASVKHEPWIMFAELSALASGKVAWVVPKGGHLHVELRDGQTGAVDKVLTSGDWDVFALLGADERRLVVAGSKGSPLERHVLSVPLAGGEPTVLTKARGVHDAKVHLAGGKLVMVDVHSASDRMPRAELVDEAGVVQGGVPIPKDADLEALALRTPELVSFPARDGTTLHGALLRPRALEPGKKHPVVVMVYGGPLAQTVRDAWAPRLHWQHLADRGFAVLQVDNRGSWGRGPAFEAPIYGKLGEVELADQLAALDWLAKEPWADLSRVGIHGHSYGGFLSAYALLRAPERFHVGIAGSAVTDWRLYDSGYTERYMGSPRDGGAAYDATALGPFAKDLRGKLFVVHALMDENVHFEHAARLVDALVAANKDFDLLVFPGERHGYRSPVARAYATRRVTDYLVTHLGAPRR